MSKFVRLTEVLATGEIKSLMVNAEFIVHIQSGMRGKDTHIRMHDAKFYFVKESFDEVQQLINAGSVAQPIIMNSDQYQAYLDAKEALENASSRMIASANLKAVPLSA
jgi:uncharacterized protein YlzI (FlbEa/FlbD family)